MLVEAGHAPLVLAHNLLDTKHLISFGGNLVVDNRCVETVTDAIMDPEALVVAFASLDGEMVDQHFGSAQGFFVYEVTADSARLITQKTFGYEKKDGNEDKLKPKLAWLAGCDVVYCGSVGGSATRQLVALGINPVQVKGGPDVEELLGALQRELNGVDAFWLQNILNQKQRQGDTDRFAAMAADEWDA